MTPAQAIAELKRCVVAGYVVDSAMIAKAWPALLKLAALADEVEHSPLRTHGGVARFPQIVAERRAALAELVEATK